MSNLLSFGFALSRPLDQVTCRGPLLSCLILQLDTASTGGFSFGRSSLMEAAQWVSLTSNMVFTDKHTGEIEVWETEECRQKPNSHKTTSVGFVIILYLLNKKISVSQAPMTQIFFVKAAYHFSHIDTLHFSHKVKKTSVIRDGLSTSGTLNQSYKPHISHLCNHTAPNNSLSN